MCSVLLEKAWLQGSGPLRESPTSALGQQRPTVIPAVIIADKCTNVNTYFRPGRGNSEWAQRGTKKKFIEQEETKVAENAANRGSVFSVGFCSNGLRIGCGTKAIVGSVGVGCGVLVAGLLLRNEGRG
jgi:hypothetical protein